MIGPVSVVGGAVHYTATALDVRITDLAEAESWLRRAIASIALSSTSAMSPEGHHLASLIGSLAFAINRVRADLEAVWSALEPAESMRRHQLGGVLASLAGSLGTVPAILAGMHSGTTWAGLRLVSNGIESAAPWNSTPPSVVTVTISETAADVAPPHSLGDRVDRLPDGPDRIRIDRFADEHGVRFEVYIGGTDFSAARDDPWWAGSNLDLLASGNSRGVGATEEAMRLAGVTATTPVVFTGHSQGGAIALVLAGSGRYAVDAVFTVGTPAGLVDDVPGVPTVHVGHINDVVPALGGLSSRTATTWWTNPPSGEWGAASHFADTYRATTRRVDDVRDSTLIELDERIASHHRGTAMTFEASGASN